jgi:hypothetical protein
MSFGTFATLEDELMDAPLLMGDEETEEDEDVMGDSEDGDEDEDDTI